MPGKKRNPEAIFVFLEESCYNNMIYQLLMRFFMKNIFCERFGILQKLILAVAFLFMTVIWPLGAFPVTHLSECRTDATWFSGPSNESGFVRQEFSPNFEQLNSISVYVVNDPDSIDTMQVALRVYDYTGVCLKESILQLEDYTFPGYVTVPVNLKLSPGILYYYTIGGLDGDLFVAYCTDEQKTAENGAFFYKEVPAGGTSVATQYEYNRPMGLKRILICDGLIAFAACALIAAIGILRNLLFRKVGRAETIWRGIEKGVQYGIAGLTVTGVVVSFVGIVILRLFTDDVVNIIVLFAGVIIAAALLLYFVLTCPSELDALKEGEACLNEKIAHTVRALLFAVTVIMCCMYINGYSNYEKGLYVRRILVFFGLFMISTGNRKQIWNLPNLLLLVPAFFGGKYYISLHSDHPEHIQTATDSAWVMWVIGLLIIRFVYLLAKGEWRRLKKISLPYLFLTLAFWIGCAVFNNGRQWTFLLGVTFTAWILLYAMSDKSEQILEDICNGILLAFFATVIFCLYRRPYQYYMLTRYGGIFFTATATATYYLVPAAAALTKTLIARRERNLKKTVFAWASYGVIAAYMGFTASRTGIISLAVMTLFALVIPFRGEKKGYFLRQFKTAGVLAVSVVLTFLMTFSATRILPAIAGNPFYFWYETPSAYITSETPWRGEEDDIRATYIDIQMTLEMLFGRMFTVEQEPEKEDYVLGALLVSAADAVSLDTQEATMQYANGRLEIFKAYLSQLNETGHDDMSALDANGEPLMHAHNSYIQVAYDFGIPLGALFLILCFVTFIRSVLLAREQGYHSIYTAFPMFLVIGFGVASIFEWVYHPCNPLGFAFLLVFAPLMLRWKKKTA